MPEHRCELDGAALVLIGSFNPAIVQPSWLARHKLIRDEEADAAEVRMVLPQLTDFTVAVLSLQVTQDRLVVTTVDASKFQPLCDLVIGMFTLLEHTPATAIGVNRMMHFRLPSAEKFRGFGDMLAPKQVWEAKLTSPALLSETMQGQRPSSSSKQLRMKIESSVRVAPFGVYFESNEHFEPGGQDVSALRRIVAEFAMGSLAYARDLADHLLSQQY